ncbi:hypothetical protein P152DRAFT_441705 [Eremomyces bilateralis CBS 781.70]|uniref:Tat pathway signal sequence n=1 Tax=Eremomyces bilateralis CBS 781.70 TaxID=1392243 RepID=A0A6G1FV35_9PEZI|nr:uncharacterized protein P152DRAFT_441705 [Eremomyces bilateralis CBS 781.70]KAF1809509.1 hypothetical protein P152DRAFT_441705 [Eremomyces bilateralis CBS 781.70]
MQNLGIRSSGSQRNFPTPTPSTPRNSLSPESTTPDSTRRRRSGSRRRSSSRINEDPYRVEDEQPPEEPFHRQDFQRGYKDAKGLVAGLVSVLRQLPLHTESGSKFASLYERAQNLSAFECPSTRTVGLIGDSGAGKSSLLNTLLDIKGLAKTSNSGAACTCVVTEFHHHNRDDFIIVVDYFNEAEITDQFRDLLDGYRRYHLRDQSDPEDGGEGFREHAALARDTFRAAFGTRLRRNEGFLLDEPMATPLNRLLDWAKELDTPLRDGDVNAQRRHMATTAEACSTRLMELTSSSERDGGAWPFICKISIYLKAYILSKGLILADLPGLRDINSARTKVTERYMLNCDEIFAVCKIGRATTDVGVRDVLQLARRVNLRNIGIICTQADDIRADEARRDWRGEDGTTLNGLMEELQTDRDRISHTNSELEDIEGDNPEEMDGEDSKEYWQLKNDKKSFEASEERHKFQLKSHLMTTRSRNVMRKLTEEYNGKFPNIELTTFCVSNTDYWNFRKKPREKAQPYMDLSGIPGIRKHCISIVAQSQLRAAKGYIEHEIPALLGSIELWVQSGAGGIDAGRKEAIRNLIDDVDKQLLVLTMPGSGLSKNVMIRKRTFKELIPRNMRVQSYPWTLAAKAASLDWNEWHHSTYAAFCRNYGDHSTEKVGSRCWNDEAMQAMVTTMAEHWDRLCQGLEDQNVQDCSLIGETLDTILQSLSTTTAIPVNTIRTLGGTLQHRRGLLLDEVERTQESFEDDLRQIERDTFTGIRSSIIGELMEGSYRSCNLEGGRGSHGRRKDIISRRFGDGELFIELRKRCSEKFYWWVDDLERRIQEVVASNLDAVQADLDMLRNENAAVEGERYPELQRQVSSEVERIGREMERINGELRDFLVV